MSARPDRRADRSGFTLIEVLVAFTVMATLLVVLYRGVVTLRQGAVAFDDHTDRELIARAVLDDALGERLQHPLRPVRRGRGRVDVEQLGVHPLRFDADLAEHPAGVGDHAARPAQPPLVDVGGGLGEAAVAITAAFPSLKCTVLDLPHVVAKAPSISIGNVQFIAGDMFESIPPANAVFLKVRHVVAATSITLEQLLLLSYETDANVSLPILLLNLLLFLFSLMFFLFDTSAIQLKTENSFLVGLLSKPRNSISF